MARSANRFVASSSARVVAERAYDAFSVDRYADWAEVAAVLLQAGFSDLEAEAIMRSKHMRWAADVANVETMAPASVVTAYLAKYPISRSALNDLVSSTFA